jgi:hypothetical protein
MWMRANRAPEFPLPARAADDATTGHCNAPSAHFLTVRPAARHE